MDTMTTEQRFLVEMAQLISDMRAAKPNDRSAVDRHWAITLTDLEKVYAYYNTFVVEGELRVADG